MEEIQQIVKETKRLGLKIHQLLARRAGDENLHGAAEHLASVIWYLEEARKGRGRKVGLEKDDTRE